MIISDLKVFHKFKIRYYHFLLLMTYEMKCHLLFFPFHIYYKEQFLLQLTETQTQMEKHTAFIRLLKTSNGSSGFRQFKWGSASFTLEFLDLSNRCCLFMQVRLPQVVLVVKNSLAKAGDSRDLGSIHGSGRSPGGDHSNPLQYSCLENPTNRGA